LTTRRNVHLPAHDAGEQRGVLVVELAWPHPPHVLRLLATHWDHRSGDQDRYASAARINQLALERPEVPSLLIGDLNTTPNTGVFRQLLEQWTVAGDGSNPTIPAQRPTRQIDFVLFRPAAAWRVVQVQVLNESQASDHRPILAVLQLR
jgi:endonuclease/exonuclease/phosphatase family metal-dependent hydrolase